jgi:methanogenic corrinoid protein MtbC1
MAAAVSGSLSSQGLSAADVVEASAEAAAGWVIEQLQFSGGGTATLQQLSDRYQARNDQRYHILMLAGALATGIDGYFTDYIRWLQSVLTSRGIPARTLQQSLELLKRYYEMQLTTDHALEVVPLLQAGLLATGEASARTESDGELLAGAMPEAVQLTTRLIAGDRAGALQLATDVADQQRDYVRIATRLFQPALYRVGFLWQCNRITVAQEHLATEISRSILARLFNWTASAALPTGRKALFAAVEQDQHVFGLQVVAEAFQIAGWEVQYLGANTPTIALIAQIDRWRPDMVGLSASLVQQLPTLRRAVHLVRGELGGAAPMLIVGGRPTNRIPGVWRWTGANGWSPDAETAVREAGSA